MNRLAARSGRFRRNQKSLQQATRPCLIEPLEGRRLLTCTINVVLASGATTAVVTSGQILHLQVWATVSGTTSPATEDNFQEVWGSFISTKSSSEAVAGNLSANLISPFNAIASQAGKSQDLNGDGSLDVGSTATGTANTGDYFFPRAGSIQTGGKVSGASESYEIATLAYTVTSLGAGQATDINFVPLDSKLFPEAVYDQDGKPETAAVAGPAFVITASGVIAPTGSISGHVYGAGNTGLAGVTVYLNTTATETTTNSSGSYSFTGLAAGTYAVHQVIPSGYTQTIPASNGTDSVTLTAGQTVTTANFTDAPIVTKLGSISGYVFNDIEGGGVYKSGDAYLPNWTVTLYPITNGKPAATGTAVKTNSAGQFSFTSLAAGSYEVLETLSAGYRISGAGATSTDVTLAAGAAVTNIAFAETTRALISGTVFNDANGNGIQSGSTETGLAGWKISVYTSATSTSPVTTTTTASNGSFTISSLSAGTYYLRVTQQTGYKLTTPTAGYYKITLVSGETLTTGLIFGEEK